MAANYWASTQRAHWLFTPVKLADIRHEVNKSSARVIEQYPYPDRRHMFIFMKDRLLQLSKRLTFRQQCVATAMTYLQRYFLFTPMQNSNIYLLVATAFYLASKTEEAPHHIGRVVNEARQFWPEFIPSDVSRLGEMEFALISSMSSQLIVWHPYRALIALKETQDLSLTNEELGLAWSVVNDTYMTDIPLTCTPHLIAVTAMFLAVVFVPNNKGALNFSSLMADAQTLKDRSFSGLGGRAGINNAMLNVAEAMGQTNSSVPRPGETENEQENGAESIKARTLAAVTSSDKMQHIVKFLGDSEVDIERMIVATQEIISLYESWDQYVEKSVKDTISRCVRGRQLDG